MADFRFKQFSIKQDQCAMKVGTDGVLLGAWCNYPSPSSILDIGTGTGLIALMCAQRFNKAAITAIETDLNASLQAQHNVSESKFHKQIAVLNTDLQNFEPTQYFDLIVCNPPFYTEDTQAKGNQRQLARHANNLPLDLLIDFALAHLADEGNLCVILPSSKLIEVESIKPLSIKNLTFLKGTSEAPIKRILVSLTKTKNVPDYTSDTLIIEEKRHEYTDAYRALTKDFYLKF
jgi:tRNA1Val (adenine37-N6)-methyltransferase